MVRRGTSSHRKKRLARLAAGLPGLLGVAPQPQQIVERQRQPHRLSPDQVDQSVADYQAGVSFKALARKYAVHTMTVKAHLLRSGIEMGAALLK